MLRSSQLSVALPCTRQEIRGCRRIHDLEANGVGNLAGTRNGGGPGRFNGSDAGLDTPKDRMGGQGSALSPGRQRRGPDIKRVGLRPYFRIGGNSYPPGRAGACEIPCGVINSLHDPKKNLLMVVAFLCMMGLPNKSNEIRMDKQNNRGLSSIPGLRSLLFYHRLPRWKATLLKAVSLIRVQHACTRTQSRTY